MSRDASLHVLQHALGLDDYGMGDRGMHPFNAYRNHYVCGPGHHGYDICMEHVEAGRMERHEPRAVFGGGHCFTVTDAGKAYVRDHSPKPPKLTRAQKRYRDWLDSGSAVSGMKFGDWLKGERR